MNRPASRTLALVGGQVCAMFAADIAEFTRPDRDDDVRRFMHEELYRILEQAFDGSGIPWSDHVSGKTVVTVRWSWFRRASPPRASSTRCPSGFTA